MTAQLIDAITGVYLWAERYDRDLQDLFALQDEITLKVLDSVQVKLIWGGDVSERIKSVEKYFRGKQGLDCYLKLMEANATRLRGSIESNNQARRMIEETMAMCPENPLRYAFLGWVYHQDYNLGNTKSPQETLDKAIELAQKALAIEETLTTAHVLLCHCHYKKGEFARAIAEGERAVALSPGYISALNAHALSLTFSGRAEEAIPIFQKAIRRSPFSDAYSYRDFGFALRHAGRLGEALSNFKKAIQIAPDDMLAHLGLTGVYIMLGHEKEARAEAAEVLRINPKFSVDNYKKFLPDTPETDRYIGNLHKAGLK